MLSYFIKGNVMLTTELKTYIGYLKSFKTDISSARTKG